MDSESGLLSSLVARHEVLQEEVLRKMSADKVGGGACAFVLGRGGLGEGLQGVVLRKISADKLPGCCVCVCGGGGMAMGSGACGAC